jgi:hypothetical protein
MGEGRGLLEVATILTEPIGSASIIVIFVLITLNKTISTAKV